MKLIFTKPGKYKSGIKVVVVNPADVGKTVFDVEDKNAENFIKVEKAKFAEKTTGVKEKAKEEEKKK